MERKSHFAAIIAAATVAAPAAQANSVSWWASHPTDLKTELAWCRENPGYAGPECVNASAASDRVWATHTTDRAGCTAAERVFIRC